MGPAHGTLDTAAHALWLSSAKDMGQRLHESWLPPLFLGLLCLQCQRAPAAST